MKKDLKETNKDLKETNKDLKESNKVLKESNKVLKENNKDLKEYNKDKKKTNKDLIEKKEKELYFSISILSITLLLLSLYFGGYYFTYYKNIVQPTNYSIIFSISNGDEVIMSFGFVLGIMALMLLLWYKKKEKIFLISTFFLSILILGSLLSLVYYDPYLDEKQYNIYLLFTTLSTIFNIYISYYFIKNDYLFFSYSIILLFFYFSLFIDVKTPFKNGRQIYYAWLENINFLLFCITILILGW